ncbi:unnamed protein product [Orchesella dallaii]|uniref:Tetraspanin-15 n=1 Tax=Orchesella dallaii TaxID=48710 RepID=A0ABP1R8C2_9HEXA
MGFAVVMLTSFVSHWLEIVPTRQVNDDAISMKRGTLKAAVGAGTESKTPSQRLGSRKMTLLLSFAFLLGTLNFYESHIVPDADMELNMFLMRVACIVNICYSFFGCIFMKCDISHIVCAFLYILPLGIFIPGLAIYGLLRTIGDDKIAVPTPEQMINMYREHYLEHNMPPQWLTSGEDEMRCCGITGPENYREFFRSESFPLEDCLTIPHDIPCSCCFLNNRKEIDSFWLTSATQYSCMSNADSKRCKDTNGSKEWTKNIFKTNLTDRNSFTIEQKCNKSDTEDFILDAMLFNNTMSVEGCYEKLGTLYMEMRAWLLKFFSLLTICPLMMLIAYVRSFCKSKQLTGQRSDHSLDIERISLLDICPVGNLNTRKP